ncbi:FIVAR domain-containing protein, partial [Streptococcus pseudopneumoniae]
YDKAVEDGKQVLEDPNATQAEVDAAKQAIQTAKEQLDGSETNKDELKAEIAKEAATKADAKYTNADQ